MPATTKEREREPYRSGPYRPPEDEHDEIRDKFGQDEQEAEEYGGEDECARDVPPAQPFHPPMQIEPWMYRFVAMTSARHAEIITPLDNRF
jgi:hypothetical protein